MVAPAHQSQDRAAHRRGGRKSHPTAGLPTTPIRRRGLTPPWWFIVPALAFYCFIVVVPSIRGAGYAFTDWNGLGQHLNFVGVDNFVKAFGDPIARGALVNTLIIAAAFTIGQNAIGLALALGVNSQIRGRNFLRVFFFAPVIFTPIVTSFLWQYIYAPQGPLNAVLSAVGLSGHTQSWLGNPSLAIWAIVVAFIWQHSGYSMIIFLAGLQSVPEELLEAGAIDGAGSGRRFWHIVRPLLLPATVVNLMLSVITGLKMFDYIWAMTQGGPGHATDNLSTVIYRNAFQFGSFGYGTALALLLAILVGIISAIQFRALRGGGQEA